MKISEINRTYNIFQTNHFSKYQQNTPIQDSISFKARNKKNLSKKEQVQNAITYLSVAGFLISSIAGFSKIFDGKKETVEIEPCSEPIVENYQEEEIETASDILMENPELLEEYNKIMQALNTYSEQLGEDALPLIKQRVALIGNGNVDIMDVLKILWIESNGKIYNEENSGILTSSFGAYGAFQLTKDTQEFLNSYFNLENTEQELDVKNPYDNLDACIYLLRFLYEKRSNDIENGKVLPTGDNIKTAVAWSYHDGAWASEISKYGQDYIEKYEKLSLLDEYPQVIEFILNS
ncbi:TPA: hypothetical protein IAA87_02820 [Candidatus Avigastranaerophilus faecigallinarum]|nr:hypothetical protein [Candidatus Avigastranaerophilus faecigallinarum]